MTILELAESLKTMNRPDTTVTLFDGLFIGKYKRWGREILTQLNFDSLQFVLPKYGIDIFDVWKLCAFMQRSNFGNFQQFVNHTF